MSHVDRLFGLIANEPLLWGLLTVLFFLGVLAVASPKRFKGLTKSSSHWVDTRKILEVLDRRVEIDHHVLRHSRILGVCLMASAVAFAVLYVNYWR